MLRHLLSLFLVGFVVTSCAHTPPNLGPAGAAAFKQHEIQKDLDVLRDVAIEANAQNPPVLSEAAARTVVQWHKSAITTLHTAANGWQATLNSGLDELLRNLSPTDARLVSPYVALVKTVLASVG